jgi:hypothetical protein
VDLGRLRAMVRDGTLSNGMMLVGLLWYLDSAGAIAWPGG